MTRHPPRRDPHRGSLAQTTGELDGFVTRRADRRRLLYLDVYGPRRTRVAGAVIATVAVYGRIMVTPERVTAWAGESADFSMR